MPRRVARYIVTYGPTNGSLRVTYGPFAWRTRWELTEAIRAELARQHMPAYLIRAVRTQELWRQIMRHGSAGADFHMTHRGLTLAFHGLTKAEAEAMETQLENA